MYVIFKTGIAALLLIICFKGNSLAGTPSKKDSLRIEWAAYIQMHYAKQLTDPEKRKRRAFSQFGYNLSYFPFPLFPITKFVKPGQYGIHCYGKSGKREKNGALYTCKGGFIDFTHVRAGVDWCVYIAFRVISERNDFQLPHEAATLKLKFKNIDQLSLDDIALMAQKIAYERLTWHEIASWHYHKPNFLIREQMSTFTPEDSYSNLMGTYIGRKVVLRILTTKEDKTYSDIVTDEINKTIAALLPVLSKKQTRKAYDLVDRHKQLKLPPEQRNKDIWWDSHIVFRDQRYIFKRDTGFGEIKSPWILPLSAETGCVKETNGLTLKVPEHTIHGALLYNYYTFTIDPDSILFFSKWNGKLLHDPFREFNTADMDKIIVHISLQMEKELLKGFGKRNTFDPVPYFKKVNKVIIPLPEIPD